MVLTKSNTPGRHGREEKESHDYQEIERGKNQTDNGQDAGNRENGAQVPASEMSGGGVLGQHGVFQFVASAFEQKANPDWQPTKNNADNGEAIESAEDKIDPAQKFQPLASFDQRPDDF